MGIVISFSISAEFSAKAPSTSSLCKSQFSQNTFFFYFKKCTSSQHVCFHKVLSFSTKMWNLCLSQAPLFLPNKVWECLREGGTQNDCVLRGETWVVINLCQFTNTGLLISLLATVSFLSFSHLIEKQTEEYRRQSCPKPQKSNTMVFWSQYENNCFLQHVSPLMCPPETLHMHMSSPKSHYQVIPEFVGTSEVPSDTAWTSFAVV